mgnify:CR=1 FL=1
MWPIQGQPPQVLLAETKPNRNARLSTLNRNARLYPEFPLLQNCVPSIIGKPTDKHVSPRMARSGFVPRITPYHRLFHSNSFLPSKYSCTVTFAPRSPNPVPVVFICSNWFSY